MNHFYSYIFSNKTLFSFFSSRLSALCFLVLSIIASSTAIAQEFQSLAPPNSINVKKSVTIAIVNDVLVEEINLAKEQHISELTSLVGNEFNLIFKDFVINWDSDNFTGQIDRIYQDKAIDMVLVLGVAANQLVIQRENYPKPTFLPFVVEPKLRNVPFKPALKRDLRNSAVAGPVNGVSNKRNLSYLSFNIQFLESVNALRQVVDFSRLAFIGDEILLKALPSDLFDKAVKTTELSFEIISHDGIDNDLSAKISNTADAVIFGYLPRMTNPEMRNLIEEFTLKGIPTFSYFEAGLLEHGLLATPLNDSFYLLTARHNALNMQAVMLGEPASQQAILVENKAKLTINDKTAVRLGIPVDFKVLVDSNVINFDVGKPEDKLSLVEISTMALQQNLNLKAAGFDLALQENELKVAQSNLLPKLTLNASELRRRSNSAAVQSGLFVDQSSDVNLELGQSIYSEPQWANVSIQKLLKQSSVEQYRAVQLDVVREASLAMADVLQAQSVAAIQKENLDFSENNLNLAQDRVAAGSSSLADQYRWETQLANSKSAVFDSFANILLAKQNLNRILNRAITDDLQVSQIEIESSMVFSAKEMFELIDNTETFEKMYKLGVSEANENSPQVSRLQLLIMAKEREIKSIKRQRWLPQFSVNGQWAENLDSQANQANDFDGRDWQLSVNARLPFYQGGLLKAQREEAQIELAQLENQLLLVKQGLDQSFRTSLNNMLTSLFNLELTREAAESASNSLSLVTDAYTQGALPIVDLLDAQNASVSAGLAQVQAFITYFRSSIEMQRIVGNFEFLMNEQEKQEIRRQVEALVNSKK